MRYQHRLTKLLTIATLMAAPLTLAACASHQQTYDPYYSDYHRWNSTEDGFYRRWEGETGRNHMEFGQRPVEEQRTYFGWRHQH
ncbi:MAG: hypothetical protein QOK07_3028 [Gemmatimonadaceae bacterium]|jgi:hypothetical protein|nr:hypothetical protein [Gemmatimonadaceae bacterium]